MRLVLGEDILPFTRCGLDDNISARFGDAVTLCPSCFRVFFGLSTVLLLKLPGDDESFLSLEDFLIILSFIFANVVSFFTFALSELRAEQLEAKSYVLT